MVVQEMIKVYQYDYVQIPVDTLLFEEAQFILVNDDDNP